MNEVIDFLEQLMRQAAELADELSEEEMAEVTRIFAQAVELIQQQEEQPLPTPREPLPEAPHESSQINGFAYDPETGKLQVQFHGKYPKAAGAEYEYDDVPPWVFDLFQSCLLYTSPSPRDRQKSRMPSS